MNTGYLVTRSARYFPERTAFVMDDRPISFRDLNARVNRLANALVSLGLAKGDRVALLFQNSLAYLEAHLAVYKAGLVWVRLNSRLTPAELKGMMDDSGAKALLHGPGFLETAEKITSGGVIRIQQGNGPGLDYDTFLENGSEREPDVDVSPDDLSDLWYTSGTTGAPKGIMLTHRNILTCNQFLLSDVYDIAPGDSFLTAGALSHAGSVRILPFITRGATCHIHSRFEPDRILANVEKHKITDLAVVPTMLIALMDHPGRPCRKHGSLKRITYAGSPMPVERIKEALEIFGPVLDQSYGQAESIITITHLSREEHRTDGDPVREKHLASTGREYPGVQIRIVDDHGRVLGANEVGEVATRSDLVMRGYWNQPEKTKEVLRDGWLHTGDVGYLDNEGYLYLVDRKNDKIITGGLNVYPREIEEVLSAHPAVAQAAVFGVADPYWGEAITAAIVVRNGASLSEDELAAFCKERLAGYKRPKKVHFLEDLPKNLYGKVLRRDLKVLFGEGGRR
jgi:acyl-CoA synthetase (AMP-forming)/AMP-acid ligase II